MDGSQQTENSPLSSKPLSSTSDSTTLAVRTNRKWQDIRTDRRLLSVDSWQPRKELNNASQSAGSARSDDSSTEGLFHVGLRTHDSSIDLYKVPTSQPPKAFATIPQKGTSPLALHSQSSSKPSPKSPRPRISASLISLYQSPLPLRLSSSHRTRPTPGERSPSATDCWRDSLLAPGVRQSHYKYNTR